MIASNTRAATGRPLLLGRGGAFYSTAIYLPADARSRRLPGDGTNDVNI